MPWHLLLSAAGVKWSLGKPRHKGRVKSAAAQRSILRRNRVMANEGEFPAGFAAGQLLWKPEA